MSGLSWQEEGWWWWRWCDSCQNRDHCSILSISTSITVKLLDIFEQNVIFASRDSSGRARGDLSLHLTKVCLNLSRPSAQICHNTKFTTENEEM